MPPSQNDHKRQLPFLDRETLLSHYILDINRSHFQGMPDNITLNMPQFDLRRSQMRKEGPQMLFPFSSSTCCSLYLDVTQFGFESSYVHGLLPLFIFFFYSCDSRPNKCSMPQKRPLVRLRFDVHSVV